MAIVWEAYHTRGPMSLGVHPWVDVPTLGINRHSLDRMTEGWRLEDSRETWHLQHKYLTSQQKWGKNRKNSVWTTSKNIELLKSYTHKSHVHTCSMYGICTYTFTINLGEIYRQNIPYIRRIWDMICQHAPVTFRLYRDEQKLNHHLVMKARPSTKIRHPPKINSSPLKNGAWKTSVSYWVPVTFQGLMLNFENVQKIGTRDQHNSQLQWILSLPLPASNIVLFETPLFLFPCADHCVALLPKKWWCFSWPNGNPWCP